MFKLNSAKIIINEVNVRKSEQNFRLQTVLNALFAEVVLSTLATS